MASSERFGYEWNKYDTLLPDYEGQFLKWVSPLTPESFPGKAVLDAGCGMGRNSYWAARYGATVTAFDLDDRSLAAARKLLSEFPSARILSGDIKTFDSNERYDIVFSIGVIHHLRDPRPALKNLSRLVKPGGTLLMWVYGYEGNEMYVRLLTPLRKYFFSKIPLGFAHVLAYIFSAPLYVYLHLFSQKRPYLQQIRTFPFKHLHSIIFDQLIPVVANYWTRDEAHVLFAAIEDLTDVRIYPVNGMSWTVIAKKKE